MRCFFALLFVFIVLIHVIYINNIFLKKEKDRNQAGSHTPALARVGRVTGRQETKARVSQEETA